MVPYTNPNYGIKMQYPSGWMKNETEDGTSIVAFSSPETDSKNLIHIKDDSC